MCLIYSSNVLGIIGNYEEGRIQLGIDFELLEGSTRSDIDTSWITQGSIDDEAVNWPAYTCCSTSTIAHHCGRALVAPIPGEFRLAYKLPSSFG